MAILNGNFGDTKLPVKSLAKRIFTRIERPAQLASAVGRLLISKIQQLSSKNQAVSTRNCLILLSSPVQSICQSIGSIPFFSRNAFV